MKKLKPSFSSKPSQAEINNFCARVSLGEIAAVIKFLDKYGADFIDAKDVMSRTALIWAARDGHKDIVGLLLEKGANINHQDKYGITPLILAAWMGQEESVAFLLEKGALIDLKDLEGMTALMYARDRRLPEIAELLEQWPEMQRQQKEQHLAAELDEITKTVMGGLTKALPYKPPFKFPPPGGKP